MINHPPLSEKQTAAALEFARHLWPGKDNDVILATYLDLMRSTEAVGRIDAWNMRDDAQEIATGKEIDPALKEARNLLLPAILRVETLYLDIPRQWPFIFSRSPATQGVDVERCATLKRAGLAHFVSKGSRPPRDKAAGDERFVFNIER